MGVLAWKDRLPAGTIMVFLLGAASSCSLAALAYLRTSRTDYSGLITLAMVGVTGFAATALFQAGGRHGWLPDRALVMRGVRSVGGMLRGGSR